MKQFVLSLTLVAGLAGVSTQAFAGTCTNYIEQQVSAQAKADYPSKQLTLVMPYIDESGGAVDQYDIPAVDQSGQVVTTYQTLVNEACLVISMDRK